MRKVLIQIVMMLCAIFPGPSCKKEKGPDDYPRAPSVHPVLLKEINIANLPSPYYHFEYNAVGQPIHASIASGLFIYDIGYNGNKISEMRNNRPVNKDRLQYSYDNTGRVSAVRYADSNEVLYKRVYLSYDGQKLIKAVRERKTGNTFFTEKTMTFLYYPDGNVSKITHQRFSINGQVEYTLTDHYELYDNKINVDAFSLLHDEPFEHLFLLAGFQLQKNNPGQLTRMGDGNNYKIEYTYTYDVKNLPLTKTGEAIITSGSDAGKRYKTNSVFSYY